jgi:hypothetical protein
MRGEQPPDDQPAKEPQEDLAARLLERRRRRG